MTHSDYANSLRKIADFLESHSEIPLPEENLTCYGLHNKQTAALVARALSNGGRCDKVYADTLITLKRDFGGVHLTYMGVRSNVCEQVKVGTKVVPEQYVAPRPAVEAHVVPEHEEAIYEWRCSPMLSEPERPALTDGTKSLPEGTLEGEYIDSPF
jgi:hypothetical protein